jgi:hypothetical protein
MIHETKSAIRIFMVHVHQAPFHIARRKEADVFHSYGIEDVFLEVRIQ